MRKEFIGYYDPTEDEIKNAWNNGVFAFDTNTLLNLYRYTEITRNDFIDSLKLIKDKLYLPYQAAFEFHSNRLSVIDSLETAYSDLESILKDNFNKQLISQLNQFKNHPSIIIDNIFKLHSDFLAKVSKELNNQKEKQPNFKIGDYVLDQLTKLFDNRIGKGYDLERLKKIYEEGKKRYCEKIPPGYKDLNNKEKNGDRHVYGDLIIWYELIDLAKEKKKSIVFVTDDRKEDWWRKENGKTIRPREELIKEFYDKTDIRILIYNADDFLKYAKQQNLIPKIKEKTIDEIKRTRIADENVYTNFANAVSECRRFNEMMKHSDSIRARMAKYAGYNNLNSKIWDLARWNQNFDSHNINKNLLDLNNYFASTKSKDTNDDEPVIIE